MAQGQRCPQGPANWGPKAPPGTPKLRINSQILPCSLPSGTIPNKGIPQDRWGCSASLLRLPAGLLQPDQPGCQQQRGLSGWLCRGQSCLRWESKRSSLLQTQAPWCPRSKGLSSLHLPGAGEGNASWTITAKLDKHFPASFSVALGVDDNNCECAFNDECTHHILSLKVYGLVKGRNGWFLIHSYYPYLIWHLTLRDVA